MKARRWLYALMLACAAAAAENPVSEKPPIIDHTQLADEPLHPTDNQAFIDDAVRAFGSREKAARLAAQSGWHHQQKGDVSVATRRFNQALILDPQCADAYWGLGVMTGQQGKYEFALQMLARALKLDPANPQLLTDSGIIYTRYALSLPARSPDQKKILEEALRWFNEAEKRDPSYQPLYTSRAIALTHLGRTKEAQSNMLRADVLARASVDTRLVDHLSRKFVAREADAAPPASQAKSAARTRQKPSNVAAKNETPATVPEAPLPPVASASPAEKSLETLSDMKSVTPPDAGRSTPKTKIADQHAQIDLPPSIAIDGLSHEQFYVVPDTANEPSDTPLQKPGDKTTGSLRLSTELSTLLPR